MENAQFVAQYGIAGLLIVFICDLLRRQMTGVMDSLKELTGAVNELRSEEVNALKAEVRSLREYCQARSQKDGK